MKIYQIILRDTRPQGFFTSLQAAVKFCISQKWEPYLCQICEGTPGEGEEYHFFEVATDRICVKGARPDHIRDDGDPLDWCWKNHEEVV